MSTDDVDPEVPDDDACPADAGAEGRRTEALLRAETQNAILNSANVAIIATDAKGVIQLSNVGAERTLGYAAGDVLNKLTPSGIHVLQDGRAEPPSTEIAIPIAPGCAVSALGVSSGIENKCQPTCVHKDRNGFPAVMSITALRDHRGKFIGNLMVGTRDVGRGPGGRISNLQECQELFQLAVESCSSGMVLDGAGTIILVNGAIERMFGYLRGELVGQPVDLLVPAMLRPQHVRPRDGLTARPESRPTGARRDLFGRRKDASEFPIEVAFNPIHAGKGFLVLSVIVDISARKDAEKHLAQMEGRYRGLLEAAPDAMVVVNQGGEIVLLNVQAEKQFGYSRDELVGQKVKNIIPEGFAERLTADGIRTAADMLARQIGTGIELSGRRKDASEFPIEIMLSSLESAEGPLVTAAIRDISARKCTERLKDEFVSTVSHELRTPLTSIAGALGLLIGSPAVRLPEPTTRLLAIAHANSQRLVRLVNDILDIEKIESGRVVFNLQRLDVQSLVEQAIEANRGFAVGYDMRVRLADTPTACAVYADPDRLVQVVTNLISNAIKFSPIGDEVTVAIEPRGEAVRISVRDHGPGIAADFRSHIFQKFAQADVSDARQKGGTGLGLSIVKQIITRLGGEVGFDDAPDGGTIFHVDLPSFDHIASRDIDLDGKSDAARILLCENDRDMAITLRQRLRKIGCATDFACTVDDALTRAAATPYAAMVVDLDLSDGDGLNLILSLRERAQTRTTPIIAMSTDPDRGREDPRSFRLNVLDWFAKPLDIDRLVQMLNKPIVREAT